VSAAEPTGAGAHPPGDGTEPRAVRAELACVVLAHDQPAQLHRLVAALDPLPVLLHVDARTPDDVHRAMVEGLPDRVHLVPRVGTAWATFGAVEAELRAFRLAIDETSATHVVSLSGSDYPLVSVADLLDVLDGLPRTSVTFTQALPIPQWGMGGGFGRLRYYHWAWRRHVVRLPVPRRLPRGLVPAGGPVQKILARHHVEAVLAAVEARPELARFWRRAWAPDETFVATILASPSLVPDYGERHMHALPWLIDWRRKGIKGPPWLTRDEHAQFLRDAHVRPAEGKLPALFARKFHETRSNDLLALVEELRATALRDPEAS
jgi:hypothetical protein